MKRKLDETDKPSPVTKGKARKPAESTTEEQAEAKIAKTDPGDSFTDFGLDARLIQAIAQQNFKKPTLVQQKAIPLALEGHDVLAKAKTGSGKTAAYLLPVLNAILHRKQTSSDPFTAALILVPTRELADQVFKVTETFTAFCAKDIQAVKLTDNLSDAVLRSILSSSPDIVISTPSRAWQNISASTLAVDKLTNLVLDEADLLQAYGYAAELENVAQSIPKGVQAILVSATLSTEVDKLKGIFCRNPTLLDVEEPEAEGEGVTQFYVKCAEDEKFLLAYLILKIPLIKGKCIIFVADVDRSYRLRLFLDQFGLRSCVLNHELPVNSRIHVVEEFNRNVYQIIIASDENEVLGDEDQGAEESTGGDAKDGAVEATGGKAEKEGKGTKKRRSLRRKDKEMGVSRGIDFKNVACVINFDLPTSERSYTHRIGRTARAGQTGMALSFVIPKEEYRKHIPTSIETAENDEKILARIIKSQAKKGKEVKSYAFNMEQVEAFRYRMDDALRAVTKVAVREARTRELRQELLKSEALKRHFEENPTELQHLRHDTNLGVVRTQPELRHVPDYLLPKEGRKALTADQVGFVPLWKKDQKNRRGKSFKKGKGPRVGARKSDPLKTFKARRKIK